MPRYRITNFNNYHPRAREVTSSQRNGNGKLKWVRLDTDWDHDEDVALLPWEERALWPWLIARAGKGNPVGTLEITNAEISQLTGLKEERVAHAMRTWRKRGRIEWEVVTPS